MLKALIKRSRRLTLLGRDAQAAFFGHRLEPEIRMLPFLVPRGRTAIDVGANVGVYTHALSKLAARVYAIEANPAMAAQLRRAYGGRATIVNAAASAEDGAATLRIPDVGDRGTGLATIAAGNALGGERFTSVTVDARRLSELVPAHEDVGFVKIDVEGHELAVLEGARPLLARSRPNILLEAEERHRPGAVASVADMLAALNYTGFMLADGILAPLAAFDVSRHQTVSLQQSAALDRGVRPAGYVNNFIFVPTDPPLP